jgi:hypothetical protein
MISRILQDATVDEAIGTGDERRLRGIDRYGGDDGHESMKYVYISITYYICGEAFDRLQKLETPILDPKKTKEH